MSDGNPKIEAENPALQRPPFEDELPSNALQLSHIRPGRLFPIEGDELFSLKALQDRARQARRTG